MILSSVFIASLLAGLLLGVRTMIVGVERPTRRDPAPRARLGVASVAAAATAFGLAGYLLLRYAAVGAVVATLVAAALAIAAAYGVVTLIAKWAVPSAAAEPPDERYLLQGTPARVTRPVSADADGEVAYTGADGAHYAALARSFDGSPLAVGDEVVIDRVEDGVAYVEAWTVVEKRL